MQVCHRANFTDFEEYKRTKNFIYILEEKNTEKYFGNRRLWYLQLYVVIFIILFDFFNW